LVYLPSHFTETREDVLLDHIDQHDFALLVTSGGGLIASQVPFLTEHRHEKLYLLGHLARPNPQAAELDGVEVMVIFPGPHAYISPGWYAAGPAVPTWNYAAVHVRGNIRFIDDADWLRGLVESLTDEHEQGIANRWRISDAPADFIDGMVRAIVGFEIRASAIEGKFKASQNRSAADRAGVAEALRAAGLPPEDVAQLVLPPGG